MTDKYGMLAFLMKIFLLDKFESHTQMIVSVEDITSIFNHLSKREANIVQKPLIVMKAKHDKDKKDFVVLEMDMKLVQETIKKKIMFEVKKSAESKAIFLETISYYNNFQVKPSSEMKAFKNDIKIETVDEIIKHTYCYEAFKHEMKEVYLERCFYILKLISTYGLANTDFFKSKMYKNIKTDDSDLDTMSKYSEYKKKNEDDFLNYFIARSLYYGHLKEIKTKY